MRGPLGVTQLGGLRDLAAGGGGPVKQLVVARVGPQQCGVSRPVQVGDEARVTLRGGVRQRRQSGADESAAGGD